MNKQIYYSESGDGGATWSNPAGLFANGNLVTIDGAPNQELFSHPEAVAARGARILYFSTRAADKPRKMSAPAMMSLNLRASVFCA